MLTNLVRQDATTSRKRLTKPTKYRALLGIQNAKTIKGEKLGYVTGISYLSPANESGVMNTCGSATIECIAACLKDSGRMIMPNAVRSRIDKTLFLHNDRTGFLESLRYDIAQLRNRAANVRRKQHKAFKPAVRINGTSDLPWIAQTMAREFPDVMFYDYTKHAKPWLRTLPNYRITFSYSGHNLSDAMAALAHGVNVAVVFDTRKGQPLPASWNGYQVIDGDTHDLRFLDPVGVVVGLRAKGVAKKQTSAFIVRADELIQIKLAA